MKIETDVTRLLGIDLPIAQAGMSWASSGSALPLAVARAGGLGVIGAGPMRAADLARAIDEVRAGTERPFAVNMPLYRAGADEILDLLVARRIPILIASQGGPKRYLERFKAIGTICLHVVAGEDHARKAADAGVDGLVVVGGEAGGHPPADLVSTLVVVRAVACALAGRLPIIASGGFADGAGLAAALALGAGAANFGTRFIATPEANVHAAYKQAVLDAGIAATRTVGRDLGMIRTLANPFAERMRALETDGATLETRRAAFAASTLKMAALEGDVAEGKVEVGQAVGLIDDMVPAGELVGRIAREYLEAVARLPRAGD
ncbi:MULTISPECIES: nitronate monooxygenase [unclassified Beijerinckia]|uniref:NAD(P)H-dependent flavin oxidoreductase n=1 Tax=unclassified Beijerinckia TaxID=2638183 RepID=UPI000898B5ED|nr:MULTISPECIES: nitronate monooxygenase [unclassified Beijerinckia]MDH7797085.1 enoyl-[acyl-carrier protein] reductase II [Beijerinckia sp. GAS462]SEC71651.1 enoyl-[acyl-carrier protein] reductase II [Beijerinckia sp. 28-YEA-48]